MNIAFLFNSDHPSLGGYYGPPVMDLILATNVLQADSRHMRVSIGDIVTYSAASQSSTPTRQYLKNLCADVYQPVLFDQLDKVRLAATFATATVYCWVFQNMTESTALNLHNRLCGADSYLGAMDVDFSQPLHLAFFRNSLIEAYRLHGTDCTIFYGMGSNEDPDVVVKEGFFNRGYAVRYEDQGARRTIFDNYDTLQHFKRVETFKAFFATLPGLSGDHASDLAHSLEELHPKLFDAFAAAARALNCAETEEDLAQSALSGRRLLERAADYLFAPQAGDWNGRQVGKAQYKNRLWAYIEKALIGAGGPDQITLNRLGKEADRLIELFNAGLHSDLAREKIELAFRDLVIWLSNVINIDPSAARDPYLAYESEIYELFESAVSEKTSEP